MNYNKIDHSEVPVRLFESDFLEFFTHISPIAVLIIWVPVASYFLISALVNRPAGEPPGQASGAGWLYIPLGVALGLVLWTFTEYTLHRFLFHHRPTSARQERIFFLFHGIHHYQPQCKTRLVMPPAVSIPLAFIFYGLFYLVFGLLLGAPQWIAPTFAAFIFGYLAYDMIHYATHHIPMRSGAFKYLKRYHMLHHYKTPEQRFGVSSPVWDVVFRTLPAA